MSSRYTADGRRRSSMTHADREHVCTCGKSVRGNGGKSSHRRACPDGWWRSWTSVYEERKAAFEAELAAGAREADPRYADGGAAAHASGVE